MNTIADLFNIGQPAMRPPKPAPEKLTLPASRDKLHVDIMNKLRLNRYDMRFMVNINEKYLCNSKPLSPGQNELYEKIVHKYRKQFKKLSVKYTDVLALPWENGIVAPEILNQQTYFRVVNQPLLEMQLYFNFNKAQIEEVRSLIHDDAGRHLNCGATGNFGNGQKYDFTWSNSTKTWRGPFNVYLFKQLYDFAKKVNVQVEDSITDIVTLAEASGTKDQWTPSVHIVHDRLYVSHIAESMLPVLDTIDPTDLSVINIERFTKLGLTAPASCAGIEEYVNSASSHIAHTLSDINDVTVLKDYIIVSGRKAVFHISELAAPPSDSRAVLAELRECEAWGDVKLSAEVTATYYGRRDTVVSPATDSVDSLIESKYNTLVTTIPLTNLFRSQAEIGKFALKADKVIYIKLNETK